MKSLGSVKENVLRLIYIFPLRTECCNNSTLLLDILSSKWHESFNFYHKLNENGDCDYNQSGGIA